MSKVEKSVVGLGDKYYTKENIKLFKTVFPNLSDYYIREYLNGKVFPDLVNTNQTDYEKVALLNLNKLRILAREVEIKQTRQQLCRDTQEVPYPEYYTPKLQELHVGFECECLNSENEWKKKIITKDDFSMFKVDGEGLVSNIKVKYLCERDIFNEDFYRPFFYQWIAFHDYTYGHKLSDNPLFFQYLTLHKSKINHKWCKIILHDDYHYKLDLEESFNNESSMIVYQGEINNKSELKRILKQVGI